MSLNNRMDKVWTTLTIEYFPAIKKKLHMPYAANTMCSKEHILWLLHMKFRPRKTILWRLEWGKDEQGSWLEF